jgi:hypothetical protein
MEHMPECALFMDLLHNIGVWTSPLITRLHVTEFKNETLLPPSHMLLWCAWGQLVLYLIFFLGKKLKGKVLPRTGHERPEGE